MSFTALIKADIDNFQRNLDKAQAQLDEFSATVGQRVASIGQSLQRIGGALTIGVTAPMVAAGTAAFNMAADLEDALGATDQIFKEAASGVEEWANSLDSAFGVSKKEALEYSNLMGSMLVNIGNLSEEQAAKTGEKLIELAGDLTAMYGGRTQDAVRALTGALKGNNTMLDNYGMAVNDALVKGRAFELGLIKQGEEMSLAAKQSATLSLIFEQTTAAQGQAAREAEGASGSWRALKTEIANLTAEMGQHLLPIITPIINRAKEMAAAFRNLKPETQRLIVGISAVAAAIGPLLLGLGTILKMAPLVGAAFSVMTGPIGIAVAAVAAAVAVIIRNWDTIRDYFTNGNGAELWSRISDGAQKLWQRLTSVFNALRDFMKMVWDRIGSNVMSVVDNAFNSVGVIIDTFVRNAIEVINIFSSLLRGDFSGALSSFGKMWGNIWNGIKQVTFNVLSNVSHAISGFLKLVGADGMGSSLENWANSLSGVKKKSDELSTSMNDILDVPLPKKLKETADTTSELTNELGKAGKETRNFREELDDTLASWGIFESQSKVLSGRFDEITKVAKNAGASLLEFQTIASRQWAEQAALQFDRLGEGFKKAGVGNMALGAVTIPVVAQVDADFSQLNERLSIVTSNLKAFEIEIGSALSSSISNMATSIGAALTEGSSVIDSIGQGLLAGLGDLARSIGEQMIAFGTAGIALKMLMNNPFLSIAAGAALVALGSMASSSIGRQVSTYSGGPVGAGYRQSIESSNQAFPRGALYNNDKQVVELKLQNSELTGAISLDNRMNRRLG